MKTNTSSCLDPRFLVGTLLALVSLFILPRCADAQVTTLLTSGTWNTATWSNGMPTSSTTGTAVVDNLSVYVPAGVSATAYKLYFGETGTGTLNINGGTLTDSSVILGINTSIDSLLNGTNTGGYGTVTVTSGTWTNTSGLAVGSYHGQGSLNITGGMVDGAMFYVGENLDSLALGGSVSISGGALKCSYLGLGFNSEGTLNMSGGTVTDSGFLRIGQNAGASGTATVSGGTMTLSGTSYVGYNGNGTLNISGSGAVVVVGGTGTLTLASGTGSKGTLNLGDGTTTAGTLNAGRVAAGSGTATVNFNHTGSYTFAPILTGSLSVNKLGSGTTTLSATSTYTGKTSINAGTLALGTNGSIANSKSVSISAGATFDTTAKAFVMLGSQKIVFQLDPTGLGSAGLINAASLDITNAVVDFSTLGTLDDLVYVLANYNSLIGSSFASVTNLPTGYSLNYSYSNGTQIALTSVPEPSSCVLIGLGMTGLALLRRKSARR